MVKTKKAILTSIISAIIFLGVLFISNNLFLNLSTTEMWIITLIVFLFSLIGMKWEDITK